MERKKRKIAESRADSANTQNLNKNNSSLRDFAKQNRGKPNNSSLRENFVKQNFRGKPHYENNAESQSGLPRRFCESARNDELNGFAESATFCHSERSEETRNHKKGKTGFRRVYNAFFYSLSGLKTAFCEEEAFRQIVLISAILIPLGAYLGENFAEKVLLILPCVMAILAELANSAIENAIDFAGLKIHPFAKNAKDMGSAMQLIACAFMGGVWIFYLIERFVI